jgi:hypothetical protein
MTPTTTGAAILEESPPRSLLPRTRSHGAILPSMSVKRKVAVPEGRSGMVRFRTRGLSWSGLIVAWSRTGARQRGAPSGDPPHAGVGNRYGVMTDSCCVSARMMPSRWRQSEELEAAPLDDSRCTIETAPFVIT